MKFRKALALLLSACLLVSTAVVALSAPASGGYYAYEQDYSDTSLTSKGNFAITGFSVDPANSVLCYKNPGNIKNIARAIVNTDGKLVVGKTYRVSFQLKVTTAAVTPTAWEHFYILGSASNDKFNAWSLDTDFTTPTDGEINFYEKLKTVGTHDCSITVKATQPTMGFAVSQSDAEFSIDKVQIKETFDLSVTVNNATGGTAKVENKNASLTGFTVGEYARFTATPATGYVFAGWYNGETRVSPLANYEPTEAVSAPYSLEARFTVASTEATKITYGYEDTEYPERTDTKGRVYALDSDAHSGNKSLKISNLSGTPSFFMTPTAIDYKMQKGQSYRVTFYAKVDKGHLWGINIQPYYQDWLPDAENFPKEGTVNTTSWSKYTVDVTVTANGDNYLGMRFYPQADASTLWLDDIEITPLVTLTFDTQDGQASTALGGVKGESISMPQNPERGGYVFTGWFTDAACTTPFTATTFPDKNTTVYAGWEEANTVTVSFETNGAAAIQPVSGRAGETLNVTAPTKEGYYFAGWYTNAAFTNYVSETVFPAENATFYAKFIQNGKITQDFEGSILKDQFDSTHFTLYKALSKNDPYVAQGEHSLKASLKGTKNVSLASNYTKLVPGTAYRATVKVLVTEVNDLTSLAFSATTSSNPWGTGWDDNKAFTYLNTPFADLNRWVEYETIFTAKHEYLTFVIAGNVTVYIDDISLEPVPMVTVNFDTQGGAAVAPLTGPAGSAMTAPTVTPPEGKSFAGWFTESTCQNRYNTAYFPRQSITLYAKWVDKGVLEQDFEAWSTEGTSTDRISLYTATSSDDPNVYSGSHSIYFENHAMHENKVLNLWDKSMDELVIGEKYKLTMKVKLNSTELGKYSTEGIFLQLWNTTQRNNGWAEAPVGGRGAYLMYLSTAFHVSPTFGDDCYTNTANQTYTTTTRDENGWLTLTYEFTAVSKFLALLFSGGPCSLYVDNVNITPFPTGLYTSDYSAPYCENFYNELYETGAMDAVNAGTKKIVELSLEGRGDYVFSASLKKGANVYLAWDAAGQNPIVGTTLTGTGSDFEMQAIRFVPDQTGKVYFVTNGTGTNCCDYLAIAYTKWCYEEDPEVHLNYVKTTDGTVPSISADQYTANANATDIENQLGASEESTENSTAAGDSPATGDASKALPVAFILLAAAGTVLATKRGKKYEY